MKLRGKIKRLLIILAVILPAGVNSWHKANMQEALPLTWWLAGATVKILPQELVPSDPSAVLELHAARQEYAPFQVIFATASEPVRIENITVEYPAEFLHLAMFREQFVELPIKPEPEIFSLARLNNAEALPDGLWPLEGGFDVLPNRVTAIWIDLYVLPETPAGTYTVTLGVDGMGQREVHVTVYRVDLKPSAAMNVIIPLEADWTVPFYGGNDPATFHLAVNNLLLEHSVVPGTFYAQPVVTANGWDFSPLDAELDALPPGALFYTPIPYNEWTDRYLLRDGTGQFYTEAQFEDPRFVEQAESFFAALAAYLREHNRFDGALVYPVDETRWVGDEPLHGGPAGFVRLASWTSAVHSAGLRVSASGVSPVPVGPADLGWLATEAVADDTHVHVDIFDSAPAVFARWMAQTGRSSSVYLNEYGDLIDMPAAIHRGLIWHVYGRGSRMISGYAALEWVDRRYDLVQMWTDPTPLSPESGYGGGALVWPGPLPSIRLKLLREGVEDARLLDLYAGMTTPQEAQNVAAALTSGPLADQNPTPDLWDVAHKALLLAVSNNRPVDILGIVPQTRQFTAIGPLLDLDSSGADLRDWEFAGSIGEFVESPWGGGNALRVSFTDEIGEAGFYFGESDWSEWDALQIDVRSENPYFGLLDVGLSDADSNYVLLRNGAVVIGPETQQTFTLPLVLPLDYSSAFDWSRVKYLNLEVNTATEQKDGFGNVTIHPIGDRTLVFDNIRLAR
jgi:hypothetical protein